MPPRGRYANRKGKSAHRQGNNFSRWPAPICLKLRSIGQNDYRVLEGRQRIGRIRFASASKYGTAAARPLSQPER